MRITKNRLHSWEQVGDEEYNINFDDELIILLGKNESSKDMADYILSIQEKADKWDLVGGI